MKKLSYFAASLAAMTMFSCSNNEDPIVDPVIKGDRVVKFTINTTGTKTEHPGAPSNAKTKILDGVIYFCDVDGNAVYSYPLTGADIASLAGPTVQPITVPHVPVSATQVVMGANAAQAGIAYPTYAGQTITTLSSYKFHIKNQQPLPGVLQNDAVERVVMSGFGAIETIYPTPTDTVYKAEIEITPALSRLEVKTVRSKGDGTGIGEIKMFRLLGIFIPNHSAEGTVSGVGDLLLVKPINTDTENYYQTYFPFANSSSGLGYLHDYNSTGLSKAASNFWAYHVFPAKNTEPGDNRLPHIVVAVDNIWFLDGDGQTKEWKNGDVQYITVTNYLDGKYNTNPTTDVAEFKRAYVYRIDGIEQPQKYMYIDDDGIPQIVDANNVPDGKTSIKVVVPGGAGGITFGLDNVTDHPYDASKEVDCMITVVPWEIEDITPDL